VVTMIVISTVAILVALVGSVAIWGGDLRRSRELGSADSIRQRTESRSDAGETPLLGRSESDPE
jgi:hypothetical protein